jgi:hypothetical protein
MPRCRNPKTVRPNIGEPQGRMDCRVKPGNDDQQ